MAGSAEANADEGGPSANVDAAVRGYREHVQLTDEELKRLAGVLNMKPLCLFSFDYRGAVLGGQTPTVDENTRNSFRESSEQLAARVHLLVSSD